MQVKIHGLDQAAVGHRPYLTLTTALAGMTVVLTAMRIEVFLTVTAGTLLALALGPMWVPSLAKVRGARLLVVVSGVCVLVGAWLTELAAADHPTSTRQLIASSFVVLNIAIGAGVLLWARTRMSAPAVAMLFGVGMVLGINAGGRFGENPWRFGFSVPATILLLAVAWHLGRRGLEMFAALALAGVSAANDGRSSFAMLLLVAVLVLWQSLPRTASRSSSRLRVVLLTAALGFSLYQLGQGLILDGYLGESTQQRTAAQLAASGSLLLGARPEAGATLALIELRPYGYGSGTSGSIQDVIAAKSGMAELNYDPNNGYVENYMFGSGIELHSVTADLWVLFGFAGVTLAALIAWHIGRHLTGGIAQRTTSALVLYLAVRTFWNLLFSPLYSSVPLLILALGLMLPLVAERSAGHGLREYSEKT